MRTGSRFQVDDSGMVLFQAIIIEAAHYFAAPLPGEIIST